MENQFDNNIDMGKLMPEIYEAVKSRGYAEDIPAFSCVNSSFTDGDTAFDMDAFQRNLEEINDMSRIQANRPLTSDRKSAGSLIVFFKKVIRKLTRFYVEPIVEDQNNFNYSVVRYLDSLNAYVLMQDACNRELKEENKKLKAQIEELKSGTNNN